jgi:hypothetical protein
MSDARALATSDERRATGRSGRTPGPARGGVGFIRAIQMALSAVREPPPSCVPAPYALPGVLGGRRCRQRRRGLALSG